MLDVTEVFPHYLLYSGLAVCGKDGNINTMVMQFLQTPSESNWLHPVAVLHFCNFDSVLCQNQFRFSVW